MKKVLLVDDEPMVLAGLKRMLHGFRKEWDMHFAGGGEEALQLMAEDPADVVISDMRMPGMNGAELLNEIMQKYPRTIRFILSGYADMEMTMQCVGGTHQFLSKPCDPEVLRSTVQRALAMENWLNNERLKILISQMTRVPGLPTLYFQILRELRSPDAPIERIGELISQDPAMTAKMLQLVNSAFFGLGRKLSDPNEAVMQLGLETIKSLVLGIHVFSELELGKGPKQEVEKVYRHSLAVANSARRIAQIERQERRMAEECFTAGLLHDIGRLVLLANLPDQYAEAVKRSQQENLPMLDVERAVLGAAHPEVGGYLLGLWGLPIAFVEAAAFHHQPPGHAAAQFNSLAVVHVANILDRELEPDGLALIPPLDRAFLEASGLWEKVPLWRETLANDRANQISV